MKGSIIVTYSAFLMGFAKNVPPKVEDQKSLIAGQVRDRERDSLMNRDRP